MNSKMKIYIALLVLLFAAVLYLDSNQQRQIDWRPTYSISDKIPLGLFVLNHEIENVLGAEVTRFEETPYEFLVKDQSELSEEYTYSIDGAVLAIEPQTPLDDESAQELLSFAGRGNNVLLSMKSFPKSMLDTLKIETRNSMALQDSVAMTLTNSRFGKQNFYVSGDISSAYFSKIDTLQTTVLGHQSTDTVRTNFIKVRYKAGNIFLHTQPAAFTNFNLLRGKRHQYAANLLSYIPDNNVYWYTASTSSISDSPLRYIFSQHALKWAWYLFIFGMIVFIIFKAKRKQRVVPIIKPLQNTTVEFAKTIGNLYYQEGDFSTMIDKKIIYFLERIRSEYLIDTTKLDDDFIRRLHQKSGKDINAIERTVHLINMHRKSYHHSVEEDLIQINKAIEQITH